MALITLQHTSINSGNKVSLPGSVVTIGYNKNNVNNSNENYSADNPVTRVQSKSIANPVYNIQRIVIDYENTTFAGYTAITQELLKQFLTLANTDSDPIYLNIIYGTNTNWSSLEKYSGSRANDIPVTINGGVNVNLDVQDSQDGYFATTSISLIETKKV